jgi:hypothetical protein
VQNWKISSEWPLKEGSLAILLEGQPLGHVRSPDQYQVFKKAKAPLLSPENDSKHLKFLVASKASAAHLSHPVAFPAQLSHLCPRFHIMIYWRLWDVQHYFIFRARFGEK